MAAAPVLPPITTELPVAAEARVLAEAFMHLLARDDEPPARWLAPAFADAVGRARVEHTDALHSGPAQAVDTPEPLTFHAAASRLACDPWSVAVAIHHLEVAGARRLPPWAELIRRHMFTPARIFDASIWFG